LIIGHRQQIEALSELPQAALLLGPVSVGKWRVAEYVRELNRVQGSDVLRIKKLTVDTARELTDFCYTAPSGPLRLAIVSLDEHTPEAITVLLKTLEELPETSHVFLVASTVDRVLPETLLSRVTLIQFYPLSTDQVQEVLERVHGMTVGTAQRLTALSHGTVGSALQVHQDLHETKPVVLLAIRYLRERAPEGLDELADRWTSDHTRLIRTWAVEALSGRWRLFNAEETGEVGDLPKLVLDALTAYNVRDRMVVQSVLPGLVT
jgi:DNA polymerase III delta prime subunit